MAVKPQQDKGLLVRAPVVVIPRKGCGSRKGSLAGGFVFSPALTASAYFFIFYSMAGLFFLILLLSLVALVISMVRPATFARFGESFTRKKLAMLFGGVAIVSFIGIGVTAEPSEKSTASSSAGTQEQRAVSNEPAAPSFAFDVPTLIGKNVDQIIETLGTPTDNTEPTTQQKELGTKEWTKTYTKDNASLLITYDIGTRNVADLFISPKSADASAEEILALGNLSQKDDRYVVELVKVMNDDSKYTGVKVITKEAQARIEAIKKQFSVWDGSHRELTRVIKDSMNDPGSYEHVNTTYRDSGDHLIVTTTFRGKNAFGAIVVNTVNAKVSLSGDVIEVLE